MPLIQTMLEPSTDHDPLRELALAGARHAIERIRTLLAKPRLKLAHRDEAASLCAFAMAAGDDQMESLGAALDLAHLRHQLGRVLHDVDLLLKRIQDPGVLAQERPKGLTARQAAQRIGTDPTRICGAIWHGELKAERVGHLWRLRPEDVDAWACAHPCRVGRPRTRKAAGRWPLAAGEMDAPDCPTVAARREPAENMED